MKIKPILFSTPMVIAIMEDRKTQTRRIVKSKEELTSYEGCLDDSSFWKEPFLGRHLWLTEEGEFHKKPKYEVDDIIWVRETFAESFDKQNPYFFKSDLNKKWDEYIKWKPSIFMPKEACRLFLLNQQVRVERVQDISEEDAIAEGIETKKNPIKKIINPNIKTLYKDYLDSENWFFSAKLSFKSLWISINGQESWDKNPYVWVYDFKKTNKPKNFTES